MFRPEHWRVRASCPPRPRNISLNPCFNAVRFVLRTSVMNDGSASNASRADALIHSTAVHTIFWTLLILGIAAHLGFALLGGNHLATPFSGGGDTEKYVLLAQNLLAGRGFGYAGVPTAFRPPLFPMILAALMWISPAHWLILLRALQFLASLLTAWLCGRLSARWFGATAGGAALVIGMLLPTQIYFTGEVLTECFASFLGIAFFLFFDEAVRTGRARALIGLGAIAGVAALERFNDAALAVIACSAVLLWSQASKAGGERFAPRARRALIAAVACGVVIAPWLVHTLVAFRGHALYSTHSGYAAVEGVIMPLGRTQPGESPFLRHTLGWINDDIENNSPARPEFRDEPALNRGAWRLAFSLWRKTGWGLVPIEFQKLAAFWLSADQIEFTQRLSWRNRALRATGVAAYWAVLLLGIAGWLRLRRTHRGIADALLFYALVLTALHLPLTMNTRLRSPLFDPLLASLAGGACAPLLRWFE